jgi:putative molybdopterin biosynthesis protein
MPNEMLNTKEVAEYLGINEKQVYALIKAGSIPCTRVTGKWIFPKHLIDRWIDTTAREVRAPGRAERRPDEHLLAAGSNDPVLDLLLGQVSPDERRIFTCNTGSMAGLDLLAKSRADIAWCHLLDPESGTYNIPYITSHLGGRDVAVVRLFDREIGMIVSAESAKTIRGIEDLARPGVRFINRQKGAGIRVFFDYHLKKIGIEPSSVEGYDREVRTHYEVGLAVLAGTADAGIASVAISKLTGLPFVPLARESFDMVIGRDTFFEKGIQAFIETLRSGAFRKSVAPLGEYDFSEAGKILYSAAS